MPAGGLNRTDADIMLYFLSGNGVEYKYRTDDPWYRGTVPGAPFGESYTTETGTTYRPEEAASPMGCMEQFQFCNTDTQHCGPLGGYLEAAMGAGPQFGLTADEALNDWAASDPTSSRFLWFTLITNALDPYSVVRVLGPQALLSVQGLSSGFQGLLPTDQWKHDVAHWWATSMALLQTTTVSVVRGLQSDLQAFGVPPQDAAQKALCANQVGKKEKERRKKHSVLFRKHHLECANPSAYPESSLDCLHFVQPFWTLLYLHNRLPHYPNILYHRAYFCLSPATPHL